MYYLEFLVHHGVFYKIEVVFLPVHHAHTYIGEAFCTKTHHLDTHVSVSLSELHRELWQCYNDRTTVARMINCINLWKLCERHELHSKNQQQYVLRVFPVLEKYRTETERDIHFLPCKEDCKRRLKPMVNGPSCDQRSFLLSVPKLQRPPPEDLRSSTVTAQLMSEDVKANDPSKVL